MNASLRLPADITEQPWALLRSTLQNAIDQADSPMLAVDRTAPSSRRQGMITVLPIRGIIEHRSSLLGEMLGGTSVETIRAQLAEATSDPDVSAVVLDVDSPGGGVTGITELAADIREAREAKPVVAVANGTAASAAYWLASQAEKVYATPSGVVGSIGIYAVHEDISGALEDAGITTTIISAGEHKVETDEHAPLTDEGRAQMQHRVDAFYDQFVGDVAKGRRSTRKTVLADYGQGRTFLASEALEAGLIDEVGTLSDALRQVARSVRSGPRAEQEQPDERLPFTDRVHAQARDLHALVAHATTRAALRDREGRPHFSADIEATLRAIRDDALVLADLLPPDEPAEEQEPATPAADPPPVAPAPPPPPRFQDREAWLAYLTGG